MDVPVGGGPVGEVSTRRHCHCEANPCLVANKNRNQKFLFSLVLRRMKQERLYFTRFNILTRVNNQISNFVASSFSTTFARYKWSIAHHIRQPYSTNPAGSRGYIIDGFTCNTLLITNRVAMALPFRTTQGSDYHLHDRWSSLLAEIQLSSHKVLKLLHFGECSKIVKESFWLN